MLVIEFLLFTGKRQREYDFSLRAETVSTQISHHLSVINFVQYYI